MTDKEIIRTGKFLSLLTIRAGDMRRAGRVFYRSANGVWLVEAVPPEFIAFPEQKGTR